MPGESFAESGQVAHSPTHSDHTPPRSGGGSNIGGRNSGVGINDSGASERKGSPVSMGSIDSGIKTGGCKYLTLRHFNRATHL